MAPEAAPKAAPKPAPYTMSVSLFLVELFFAIYNLLLYKLKFWKFA
jgi:hypothetical protein